MSLPKKTSQKILTNKIMAICGYNEKIGNGLKMLVEGMIDALEKKAATSSAEVVLKRELVELDNIISVLKTAPGEVLPEMFIGLNLLAKSMFSEVQKELYSSQSEDLASACRKIGNNFVDLLAQTELKNEELRSRLDAGGSVAENAQNLARWALKKSLRY
jgi:hypothetical protein